MTALRPRDLSGPQMKRSRVFSSLDVSPASNRRWSKSMRCELSSNFLQLIRNPSTVSQSLTLATRSSSVDRKYCISSRAWSRARRK